MKFGSIYSSSNAYMVERCNRSDTVYAEMPLSVLKDRGISSERLESLLNFLPEGAYVAGGYIGALMAGMDKFRPAKDIDIFFTSEDAAGKTMALLLDPPSNDLRAWAWQDYRLAQKQTEGCVDFRCSGIDVFALPIQLVQIYFYDDPEHIIDNFDLTAVQFAIGRDRILHYNPVSLLDIAAKKISINRRENATKLKTRVQKYLSYGWSMTEATKAIVETL